MGVDVIDFTMLQKRGMLKKEEIKPEVDVIDFTKSLDAPVPITNQQPVANPLSFFDSVVPQQTEPTYANPGPNLGEHAVSGLKLKLEDLEYKFERLLEKLDKVESKLFNFENKVG